MGVGGREKFGFSGLRGLRLILKLVLRIWSCWGWEMGFSLFLKFFNIIVSYFFFSI